MAGRAASWIACGGLVAVWAGCAQIFGVDYEYRKDSTGASSTGGSGGATTCVLDSDCTSQCCRDKAGTMVCEPEKCCDGAQNGQETAVDCGGPTCSACPFGEGCLVNSDCVSDACDGKSFMCVANQCADHQKDGVETDVDCGGGTCAQCVAGSACGQAADCASGVCCVGACANVPAGPYCSAYGGNCPSATQTCSATGCSGWASWPWPNAPSTGLPHPASYDTTSQPGVVIDNVTALWWQQPIDAVNNQGQTCAGGCNQADAIAYCANLTLAGHCDWRLPTRIELASIVDYTVAHPGPTINAAAFPNTPNAVFWTSSSWAGSSGDAWYVDFLSGGVYGGAVGYAYRVRCVR